MSNLHNLGDIIIFSPREWYIWLPSQGGDVKDILEGSLAIVIQHIQKKGVPIISVYTDSNELRNLTPK